MPKTPIKNLKDFRKTLFFFIKPPFNRLKNKNSTPIQKQLLILICFSWQDKRKKKKRDPNGTFIDKWNPSTLKKASFVAEKLSFMNFPSPSP